MLKQFRSIILLTVTLAIGLGLGNVCAQASVPNSLVLNLPGSACIKPGDSILVSMDVSNLLQPVSSCQAFLNFSSSFFLAGAGDLNVAPGGGGVWEELIWQKWNTTGDLDIAVGVKLVGPIATSADGTVAKMTLKSRSNIEGQTNVVFRSDANPDPYLLGCTIFGGVQGEAIWPAKLDSPTITIDGTAPNIDILTITQNGVSVMDGVINTLSGTANIAVTADDPVHGGVSSGIAMHPVVTMRLGDGSVQNATYVSENPQGTYFYTWTVQPATPNGSVMVTASVSDRSGNQSSNLASLEVNRNKVVGSLTMDTLIGTPAYSFDRLVVIKATDQYGSLLKTWDVPVMFTNNTSTKIATGTYVLTDVPQATGALSAKTDWCLRRKQEVSLDANGQATVNFADAYKLLGGDLNTDNMVNVADYNTLRTNWLRMVPAADVNGDGKVNVADYNIMFLSWFKVGDPI